MTIHPTIQKFWRFLRIVFNRFNEDGCAYRAAALTYTTLLSLVPLMAVSFAILSAFPVFKLLSAQIQNFIFDNFVATSSKAIQLYLQEILRQVGSLPLIGFLSLVITAILMMFNMDRAINEIWRVKERRKGISAIVLYWAVLTFAPLLLGISIAATSYLISLKFISEAATHLGLVNPILHVLPFVLSIILFAFFYAAIPNCHVPIRYAVISAIIAGFLFELAKGAFTFYVTNFPVYALLYGALASIPLFLIWLYICWVIILFGAVISNVLTVDYAYRAEEKMDGFTQIYRWLGHFWCAFQKGESLSLHELIDLDPSNYQVSPVRQLDILLQAHLIQPIAGGRFILSKDLSRFTIADLLQSIPWRLPTSDELAQWHGRWENDLKIAIESIEKKSQPELSIPLAKLYAQ